MVRYLRKDRKTELFASLLFAALAALVFLVASEHSVASSASETERLYKGKCSICHGTDGAGKTAKGKKEKVRDFRSPEVQKDSDQQLAEAIRSGKGKMRAVGKDFSQEQVKDLVAYIRELGKRK